MTHILTAIGFASLGYCLGRLYRQAEVELQERLDYREHLARRQSHNDYLRQVRDAEWRAKYPGLAHRFGVRG